MPGLPVGKEPEGAAKQNHACAAKDVAVPIRKLVETWPRHPDTKGDGHRRYDSVKHEF